MDTLPTDPMMLFSTVNMLLRDGEYSTLDDLCSAFGVARKDLEAQLSAVGFEYNEAAKKFW